MATIDEYLFAAEYVLSRGNPSVILCERGIRTFETSMAKAAIAAGADGLLIEVHYRPEEALCDGSQALYPEDFGMLMADLRKIAEAVGRSIYNR